MAIHERPTKSLMADWAKEHLSSLASYVACSSSDCLFKLIAKVFGIPHNPIFRTSMEARFPAPAKAGIG
jgi:hypothetical protein